MFLVFIREDLVCDKFLIVMWVDRVEDDVCVCFVVFYFKKCGFDV